jgi:DNA-binding IclR family transcriptional regulator
MTTDLVKSAARVLDVLELFAADAATLGVSEVARNLGVPKSSAQGLFTTRGYLAREGTSYYLPRELRTVGWIGGLRARLVSLSEPVLRRITDECGESSFLGVLVGKQIQYVAKSVSSYEVRYDASMTQRKPAFCTSTGLAILAHLDPVIANGIIGRSKLVKITPNTITDRSLIARMMERARLAGFSEIRDPDACAVAAPVFGAGGEVVAAVSIGIPSFRYARARKQVAEIVVAQTSVISRLLSAGPDNTKPARSKSIGNPTDSDR